jgi:DNA polymerase-3 subunit epsilon
MGRSSKDGRITKERLMIALAFDTETSGMVNFRAKSNLGKQPHVIQLAAILVDTDDWSIRSKFCTLVKLPTGVQIEDGAKAAHGISEEECERYGVDPKAAFWMFNQFAANCQLLVAHNIDFDSIIMNALHHRVTAETQKDYYNYIGIRRRVCTMKTATDVMKIPGNYGFKWPKLQEAYEYFTGKPGGGWHDALADTEACVEVFKSLVNAKVIEI